MFLRPLFAAAAATGLCFLTPQAQAQNLLANPGFEDDVLAPLADTPGATGWTDFGGGAFTRFQSPHTGNNALKVFNNSGAFQDFAATPGTEYEGSVFALNPNFDQFTGGMIGAVNLEFRDGGGNLIGDILTNPLINAMTAAGDSEGGTIPDVYTFGTVTAVAPAGTASVRLALFAGGGGGAAYFDDASLQVVPEPASLAVLAVGGLALATRRRRCTG